MRFGQMTLAIIRLDAVLRVGKLLGISCILRMVMLSLHMVVLRDMTVILTWIRRLADRLPRVMIISRVLMVRITGATIVACCRGVHCDAIDLCR